MAPTTDEQTRLLPPREEGAPKGPEAVSLGVATAHTDRSRAYTLPLRPQPPASATSPGTPGESTSKNRSRRKHPTLGALPHELCGPGT